MHRWGWVEREQDWGVGTRVKGDVKWKEIKSTHLPLQKVQMILHLCCKYRHLNFSYKGVPWFSFSFSARRGCNISSASMNSSDGISTAFSFSCCPHLGAHFSFILQTECSSVRTVFPLTSPPPPPPPLPPLPWRRSLSEQNFKMLLDASWTIREEMWRFEGEKGDRLYFISPLVKLMQTWAHAHVSFSFLPWAQEVSFRKEKVDKRPGAW